MATTRTYPPPEREAVETAMREAAQRLKVRVYRPADFFATPAGEKRRRNQRKAG